jgi:histidinol-phosphate aminotransferase
MLSVRAPAPALAAFTPYDPSYLPARVYLNANENPYGLPASVAQNLAELISRQEFHRYPDPLAKRLRARIAAANNRTEDTVLLGNGGDELLFNIMLAYGGDKRKLLTAPPSFSSYDLDAKLTNTTLVEVFRVEKPGVETDGRAHVEQRHTHAGGERAHAEDGRARGEDGRTSADETCSLAIDENAILERVSQGDIDVVMLASPNNPTGDVLSERFILELLDVSDAVVLIDQAYVEFADACFDMTRHLDEHENLALLRTFSKAWALAGIRLGYLLASRQVISELCKVRQPYSVDTFSACAGNAVLDASEEIGQQVAETVGERTRVVGALTAISGIEVFETQANFILFRLAGAHNIWQRLYEEHGILLRDFSAARGLTDCLRASIGTPSENDEFINALQNLVAEESMRKIT